MVGLRAGRVLALGLFYVGLGLGCSKVLYGFGRVVRSAVFIGWVGIFSWGCLGFKLR